MSVRKFIVGGVAIAIAVLALAVLAGAPATQAASLSGEKEAVVVGKGQKRGEKVRRWRSRERPQCAIRCDDITYRGYRRHRESVDSWFPVASVVATPFVGSKCATADACYLRNPHGDGWCGCDPDGCCQYYSTYYGRCNPCE